MGPSGMTAAIYASRLGLKTAIFEGTLYGGQMNDTGRIENYPGFKSITGMELSEQMFEQMSEFDVDIFIADIDEIEKEKNVFWLSSSSEDIGDLSFKSIVLATGASKNKLNVDGELENAGKGISYCAICDGDFFAGKEVLVIGGGESAFEEGLILSEICKKVTLMHRGRITATNKTFELMKNKNNVEIVSGETLSFDNIDGKIQTNLIDGGAILKDGVFIYVGMKTNMPTSIPIEVVLDKYSAVLTDSRTHESIGLNGFYAIGDVESKSVNQIVYATGSASQAILSLYKNLQADLDPNLP